jgi:2-keto-4-pentenoate hydratase/2-oxohepta-3-ene-1,7-dioic acid hydratase in catechol pathway
MKLFYADDYRLCVLRDDRVIDVSDIVADIPHLEKSDLMAGLIARFDAYRGRLEDAMASREGQPLAAVRLRAPLPRPRNIVCMAVNYMEDGTRSEPAPINAFHKAPNAVIGTGETMVLPDAPATNFEAEAEIAVVIGKRAFNVSEADAMSHVFGYTNFIDGSARNLPPAGNVFFQAKSRETFAPIGPFIVTADEVPDPQNVDIRLWVNGELKQSFNSSDMAHKIARCIAWVSSIHALEPGDVLATGTNHRGLSSVQDGDTLELECTGLGRLTVAVRDDLKRTWPRDTRSEREARGLPSLCEQLTGKYAKAG